VARDDWPVPETLGGAITDVSGIRVGHYTGLRRPTGCTVILPDEPAIAGVEVRGSAPGTRETDLLAPVNLVEQVHAVVLSGGSAFGLDAASGVMRWLDEHGRGFPVGAARVPIVPGAVLFDLEVGDHRVRPDADAGYRAAEAATDAPPAEGSVGAGTGATVGKLWGMARAMKGGIGTASATVNGITVGAIVAVNAVGDVVDPRSGRVVAGARTANGLRPQGTTASMLAGEIPEALRPGTATTIGCVATDARLTKPQAQKLAQSAHGGYSRAIDPAHTMYDGDTIFALATGRSAVAPNMILLTAMAATVMASAILRAVTTATAVAVDGARHVPAWADMRNRS
jgi:L-aminopeptidase/D-esterase-like protein